MPPAAASASPSPNADYARGHLDGEVKARLDGHDTHLAAINGSIDRMVAGMEGLKVAVTRLGDQAIARDLTVVTTAAALEKADTARRAAAEQGWSPITKGLAILTGLSTLIAICLGVLALVTRHH
jgi:hypothetical protein